MDLAPAAGRAAGISRAEMLRLADRATGFYRQDCSVGSAWGIDSRRSGEVRGKHFSASYSPEAIEIQGGIDFRSLLVATEVDPDGAAMSSDPWPIAIMSFNRPDYLAQLIDSLMAQRGGVAGRRIALFQDGSWSPTMNTHHADPALIRRCVDVFCERIPQGEVFESDTNLGIAMNIDRAERFVFETVGASAGIFFEDDLVLGPVYLTVLEHLIKLALADERIGYVAAFGNVQASPGQQLENARKLRPLHLLWGFGLTRRHWLKCRPYVMQYLKLVRDVDYRRRDHEKISALVTSWGVKPGDTGQDRIKSFVTAVVGATKLNTEVSYAKYIGEKGSHFTPEIFAKWGFDNATFFFEVQDLDFDLASVNFDPWYVRNNLSRLDSNDGDTGEVAGVASLTVPGNSPESRFVRALYRVLLLREPDVAGLIGHVRRMESGESPDNVVRSLIKSDEFLRNYASFMDTYVSAETSVSTTLQPMMTHRERDLFASFLRCSRFYLEFGTGGSTILASKYVGESVTSVDSSKIWQTKVAQLCAAAGTHIVPVMVHVDIGPIGDLGYPIDDGFKARWPDYASHVWAVPKAWMSDLCLIDGRFRVATFISTLLRCSPLTIIMIHDFPERAQYHVIRQFADEIALVDSLAVFRRKSDFNAELALSVLEETKYQAA